jgi:hypothetical protein
VVALSKVSCKYKDKPIDGGRRKWPGRPLSCRVVTSSLVPVSGEQIKFFLDDGTPGGPTTAEITNWT